MGEYSQVEKPRECIFIDLDLLNSLYENKVPRGLEGRFNYCSDSLSDGTSLEVYTDVVTGDQFRYGTLSTDLFVTVYRIIKTRVGEYKILSWHNTVGYIGSIFYFNDEETDENTFWRILGNQAVLCS
ncbi:MAG: hypothetical protein AB9915_00055 [Candidatus Dojkabacteria bacterium]